jgi:hypothetical protein
MTFVEEFQKKEGVRHVRIRDLEVVKWTIVKETFDPDLLAPVTKRLPELGRLSSSVYSRATKKLQELELELVETTVVTTPPEDLKSYFRGHSERGVEGGFV